MKAVMLVPLTSFKRSGLGERLPAYPGPAGVRRSFSVLPRIETFLGALASAVWSREREASDCDSWKSCVLDKVLVDGGKVIGPFLLLKLNDDWKVYVDAFEGLISIEGIEELVSFLEEEQVTASDAGAQLRKAVLKAIGARTENGKLVTFEEKLNKLKKNKMLITKYELNTIRVGIALDPFTKTTGHGVARGMIYSLPEIWLFNEAKLVYLVEGLTTDAENVLEALNVMKLGPRNSYFALELHELEVGLERQDERLVVLSEMPYTDDLNVKDHLLGLDPYITRFLTYGLPVRREIPEPALKPGTLLSSEGNWREERLVRALPLADLRELGEVLTNAFT